jgi:hypothetical protein
LLRQALETCVRTPSRSQPVPHARGRPPEPPPRHRHAPVTAPRDASEPRAARPGRHRLEDARPGARVNHDVIADREAMDSARSARGAHERRRHEPRSGQVTGPQIAAPLDRYGSGRHGHTREQTRVSAGATPERQHEPRAYHARSRVCGSRATPISGGGARRRCGSASACPTPVQHAGESGPAP